MSEGTHRYREEIRMPLARQISFVSDSVAKLISFHEFLLLKVEENTFKC